MTTRSFAPAWGTYWKGSQAGESLAKRPTGRRQFAKASEVAPDIAIIDCSLAILNGVEVIRQGAGVAGGGTRTFRRASRPSQACHRQTPSPRRSRVYLVFASGF